MTTNSTDAADKALGVTELLKGILFHLPMKGLIHAQPVCKRWRAVINGSKVLRQNLCLEVQPEVNREENTSLTNMIGPFMAEFNFSSAAVRVPHPFLERAFQWPDHGFGARYEFHYDRDDNYTSLAWLPSWPPGQWQNMFAMQPPTKKMKVYFYDGYDLIDHDGDDVAIEDPAGIRLGQIAKTITESLQSLNLEVLSGRLLVFFFDDDKGDV